MITRISRAIEKANALIESLSVILAIINPILGMMINDLENLKAQLRDPISKIDQTATNIPNLNSITGINNFGTNFGSYKGFTFALKEENNPKFNVRGNKRHYAVAINKNNVGIITFEHEAYRIGDEIKLESEKILNDLGFYMLCENVCNDGNSFENWYINTNIYDIKDFEYFISNNKEWSEIIFE